MATPALRIASLSPAATEWICVLGADRRLVARLDAGDFSLEDIDRLRVVAPDMVILEHPCGALQRSERQLFTDSAWPVEAQPRLYHFAPCTLKQVLNEVLRLGRSIGRTTAAMEWIADAEKELYTLRSQLGLARRDEPAHRPRVLALDSLTPLCVAGRWVPDLIEQAGGQAALAEAGTTSRAVTGADVAEAKPDVLAVMPAGHTLEHTRREVDVLYESGDGFPPKGVQEARVYLFDGQTYFNRPGPRLYRSIALLAAAIQPGVRLSRPVESWEMERYHPLKR